MYFSYFFHAFRTIMQDLGRLVWTPTILTFMNIKRNCFSSLIFSMSTFHIQKNWLQQRKFKNCWFVVFSWESTIYILFVKVSVFLVSYWQLENGIFKAFGHWNSLLTFATFWRTTGDDHFWRASFASDRSRVADPGDIFRRGHRCVGPMSGATRGHVCYCQYWRDPALDKFRGGGGCAPSKSATVHLQEWPALTLNDGRRCLTC